MKALAATSVDLLCSGQVITCVVDAVKELIENSLDAGAKNISIKLTDQGLGTITVTDDGSGISKDGRDSCALAYTTSKISSFEDLSHDLSTFGFRGEALHSICCLSDLAITTRCRDEDSAITMTFNPNGSLKKIQACAAPAGTTVIVSNLLKGFPVRIREERTNFNQENIKSMMTKYFLAAPTVRFSIDFQPYYSMTRQPLSNLFEAASFEFGPSVASHLCERTLEKYQNDIRIRISGLIPSSSSDWKDASTSRMQVKQFLYVNGRPVHSSDIEKHINEVYWKLYGSIPRRFPRYIICIDFFRETQIDSSLVDINIEPSKSKVILSARQVITQMLDSFLATESKNITFAQVKAWPDCKVEFEEGDQSTDWLSFGSFKWVNCGSINDFSIFNVEDGEGKTHLVGIQMGKVYEKVGISRVEAGRTKQSELVTLYWDQILELHKASRIIKLIATFS